MPQEIPTYILSERIIGASPKYKWNNDLAMDIGEAENDRLYGAIDKSNFKAKMAVGVMLTEWVIWRFEGLSDLTDAKLRIDAAWAGVIDPLYIGSLEFELTNEDDFHDKQKILGPIEIGLDLLEQISSEYIAGSIYLAEPVVSQAMLARHLMPDKKAFSEWLSRTLQRTTECFPRLNEHDRVTERYDASHEEPVPREFFETSTPLDPVRTKQLLESFLKTLDPSTNPYLRSADEMKEKGFKGTPYSLVAA